MGTDVIGQGNASLVQSRRSAWNGSPPSGLIFAILALSVSVYVLLQSVTIPALALIQADYGTDQATVSWVLTAFLVSAAVVTPIVGRLGDSYGKRQFFVASLIALAIGSLLAAWAPSIGVLIFARLIQGLSGGMIPLAFGIIRDELPAEKVPFAIGVLSSLLAVGVAVGIVLAGLVVDALGYHWLFVVPGIGAVVMVGVVWCVVPASRPGLPQPVKLLPAVLLASWLVCVLIGITKGSSWGWLSWELQSLLWGGLVLIAIWVVVEWRGAVPLIDLRLMRQRGVAAPNVVALLIGMASYGSFAFLPQFVQTPSANGYGFGATVSESGFMMLPSALLSFVAGFGSARLTRRWGARLMIGCGCMLTGVGLLLVVVMHEHVWQIYLANAVSGFGSGLGFACLANAVVAAVPQESTSVATGMNANLRTIGGAIGGAALAGLVTTQVLPSGYSVESGYTRGFALLAVMAFLAAGASAFVPGPQGRVRASRLRRMKR